MTWKLASLVSRDSQASYLQLLDTTSFLGAMIFLLVSIWSLIQFKCWYKGRARLLYLASKLPGPPTIPVIGNALQFACNPDETLDRIKEIVNSYESPMRFWLGPKLFIVLTEPRDFEIILGCQKASYKDPVYRFMEPFVGKGLVSGSGPVHRNNRKVIMPMLNNKALLEYIEHFNFHSKVCCEVLEERLNKGDFDIQPYLIHCTFDMIFDTILGLPGNSQKHGYKELVYWTETMYELIHLRMMKIWLHPDNIFRWTDLGRKMKEGQRVIHSFIESAVTRKKKEYYALERGAISTDRPRLMLLEQLIDQNMKMNLMNDEELRDQIYTLFTAAQDTTAVISSFALLHLAMDQKIQNRVREEIREVVGSEKVMNEHLPDLKFTEMVIKETLRLYPIAPLMVRQVTGDIDLETCTLPKGCSVVMVPFMTHRNKKYWDDPEKFIPERFLPENSDERHPYAYIPFSGGLRGCIGQKYAMMCLKIILVHILRNFRLHSERTTKDIRLKTDISIRSKDGYKVSISRI
ncbi:hypothetical protein QAD02_004006 [Eretmocerus hayati]|uniref:Uncharacterized protein n=1 Tax=Eretmocerus hayati TaxID=131215 RepID=A0ACC2NQ56_9HYME|nr:hypothetical protein QAD02_004006 [Eretmocerus hayati]